MRTGGPAFPQANDRVVSAISIASSQGMTLRDYFAAKALPMAIDHWKRLYDDGPCGEFSWRTYGATDDTLAAAELAYRMADAMIKAREL